MPRMERIHIVGCGPRSGTTLLTELMAACFDIDARTEHETRLFAWPPLRARIFLTKAPRDILVVEPVLRLMHNLHVIYMLRDPRDMIVSRHGGNPERYWSGLKFWKRYAPVGRRLASHPRFITLRYEDLVLDPDGIQAQLAARMPFLRTRAPFSRYHEVARPSRQSLAALRSFRPISAASVGRWRDHLPRVAGQLALHGSITDDLIVYGFEEDATWERSLEGVEPDTSPSHMAEHFPPDAIAERARGRYTKAAVIVLAHQRLPLLVFYACRTLYRKLRTLTGDPR